MILITRPEKESLALAEILERQNFECLIEPMIKIKYLKPDWEALMKEPVQAFIATSKNARKLITPGYKLAAIPEHGKNARQLLQWIIKNLQPQNGRLVYLRGDIISFDMSGELRKHNFKVDEKIVYESQKPDSLSTNLINNLNKIDLALFFSARSLKNFIDLIIARKLQPKLRSLRILCMSEEIADVAQPYSFKDILTADEPSLNGMINKIDEVY